MGALADLRHNLLPTTSSCMSHAPGRVELTISMWTCCTHAVRRPVTADADLLDVSVLSALRCVGAGPCSGNTPHTHPRGSEISYMTEGEVRPGRLLAAWTVSSLPLITAAYSVNPLSIFASSATLLAPRLEPEP